MSRSRKQEEVAGVDYAVGVGIERREPVGIAFGSDLVVDTRDGASVRKSRESRARAEPTLVDVIGYS